MHHGATKALFLTRRGHRHCMHRYDRTGFFQHLAYPSVHLQSISGRDIDDDTFARCDYTVLSMREGKCNEGLNFAPPVLREKLEARSAPFKRPIQWEKYPELGEVILGTARKRVNDEGITFFCNNVGFGAQFAP